MFPSYIVTAMKARSGINHLTIDHYGISRDNQFISEQFVQTGIYCDIFKRNYACVIEAYNRSLECNLRAAFPLNAGIINARFITPVNEGNNRDSRPHTDEIDSYKRVRVHI